MAIDPYEPIRKMSRGDLEAEYISLNKRFLSHIWTIANARPIPVSEGIPNIDRRTEESGRVYAFNKEARKWSNAWVVTYGGQSPRPEWYWEDDRLSGPATHWLPIPLDPTAEPPPS